MLVKAVAPNLPEAKPKALSVLVVDDEPSIRRTYEMILSENGWSIKLAANGREALQILMQHKFDVLVVDLRMEQMDGLTFLQEALKVWPWVGVVIISAYATKEAIAQAQALGVTRILEKPVSVHELCQNVEEAAREKRIQNLDEQSNRALTLMRDQLRLLTELSQEKLSMESCGHTILKFSRLLAENLDSEVVGLLIREDLRTKPMLMFTIRKPVSQEFLAKLKTEMLARYSALSGLTIPETELVEEVEGKYSMLSKPTASLHTLSVPFLLGNHLSALLTLATGQSTQYSPEDISLFYHAANHIPAVFSALRRMHHLAIHDPLTNLYNRLKLEEELEREWLVSQRYRTSMGVVVLDLDNFKIVNDSYGHTIGDEILVEFAELIRSAVRATDIVGRYGGDEFVVILPRATDNEARIFAERLLSLTREHVFCHTSNPISLTISIGIATSQNPTAPSTCSSLLSQADRALYMAKRAGRSRICIWPGRYHVTPKREGTEQESSKTKASDGVPAPAMVESTTGILLVDDEEQILTLLSRILEQEGYRVFAANCGKAALEELQRNPNDYCVLVADLTLPDTNGTELIGQAVEFDPDLVGIILTAHATVDNAVASLQQGAYDFLQKPILPERLCAVVRRALEYRALKIENIQYQTNLEEIVKERSVQLARTLEEVKASYEFTLEALVAMLDAREHQTGRHSIRVRELAVTLARHMGIRGKQLDTIASGALLHDIGKISIPDGILFRPGSLEPDEWKIVKKHSEIGYNILRTSPYLREAAEIVYAHQERYDGTGYPRGLKGDQICLGARIFAVVDAYDAMRSFRVYQKPMGEQAAVEEIRRNSGKQFDPAVVQAFLECQPELERVLQALSNDAVSAPHDLRKETAS
ncbi:MAG: diguanylate cyclase [Kiritimatiellia bacterium]